GGGAGGRDGGGPAGSARRVPAGDPSRHEPSLRSHPAPARALCRTAGALPPRPGRRERRLPRPRHGPVSGGHRPAGRAAGGGSGTHPAPLRGGVAGAAPRSRGRPRLRPRGGLVPLPGGRPAGRRRRRRLRLPDGRVRRRGRRRARHGGRVRDARRDGPGSRHGLPLPDRSRGRPVAAAITRGVLQRGPYDLWSEALLAAPCRAFAATEAGLEAEPYPCRSPRNRGSASATDTRSRVLRSRTFGAAAARPPHIARRPGLAAVDVTADDRKLLPDDTAPSPTIEVDGNLAGARG